MFLLILVGIWFTGVCCIGIDDCCGIGYFWDVC